eukprot:scaffold347_cov380-Prasinococcus_capsulatus_cf.AAC.31
MRRRARGDLVAVRTAHFASALQQRPAVVSVAVVAGRQAHDAAHPQDIPFASDARELVRALGKQVQVHEHPASFRHGRRPGAGRVLHRDVHVEVRSLAATDFGPAAHDPVQVEGVLGVGLLALHVGIVRQVALHQLGYRDEPRGCRRILGLGRGRKFHRPQPAPHCCAEGG